MNGEAGVQTNDCDGDDDLRRLFQQDRCRERPVDAIALLSLADQEERQSDVNWAAAESGPDIGSARLADQSGRRGSLRRWRTRVAAAASLTVAVSLLICFAWPASGRIAMADVQRALSEAKSIHMVIHMNLLGDPLKREAWYRPGAGWAIEDRAQHICDNGVYRWHWDASSSVTRSRSQLDSNGTLSTLQLAASAGIAFDDFTKQAVRNREKDRAVDGESCRAFEMPAAPSLPTASHADGLAIAPLAKTVFLVDLQDRIRYCENQVLVNGEWLAYRSAHVTYDVPIAPDRFAPKFDSDVVIHDSVDLAAEREQQENPVDPVILRLTKGIEEQQQRYLNLAFFYDVTVDVKHSPEATGLPNRDWLTDGPIATRDVLRIMAPSNPQNSRPWRLWIRNLTDPQGNETVERFAAYDQDRLVCFLRNGDLSTWNRGFILPHEDPAWWHYNVFDSTLFMRINGSNASEDTQEVAGHFRLQSYRVTDRKRTSGKTVYSLHGMYKGFGMEYFVQVSGAPDYLVLRWAAKELTEMKRTLAVYEVISIGTFGDVTYPSSGRHRQLACRELPDVTYEFKVTAVQHLEESDRERWIPEWPTHTIVRDQITDLNLEIQ